MSAPGAPARESAARAALPKLTGLLGAWRPLLWIPAVALFEAGRTDRGGSLLPPIGALPSLLALLALLGAVHVANAWRDRAGDRLNLKGGAVAAGRLGGRALAIFGGATFAASAAMAALLGRPAQSLLAAALVLGIAYVAPPIELKRRAGFDLLAQAIGYGVVAYWLGWNAADPRGAAGALAAAPRWAAVAAYALGIATVGLVTMLADRPGDDAAGQRTTAVVLGTGMSERVATLLALATAAAGFASASWAPAIWGLAAATWLGLGPTLASPNETRDWNRDAVFLQVVFLALLLPRAALPLSSAVILGGASAWGDVRRGGTGYPLRARRRISE